MNDVTITTERGEIVISPLTIMRSIQLADIEALVRIKEIAPAHRGYIRTFIFLLCYTTKTDGLPPSITNIMNDAFESDSQETLMGHIRDFYRFADNHADLFIQWNEAVAEVAFGKVRDETDDEKKAD